MSDPSEDETSDGRDRQVRGAGCSEESGVNRPVNMGAALDPAAEYATGPPSGDFCRVCGKPKEGHPIPPPGPPDVPPERYEGVWRRPHAFEDSGFTVAELLDERDAQIKVWRGRANRAERRIQDVRKLVADDDPTARGKASRQ